MGQIYSKYLNEFDLKWDYYDPFVNGGLKSLSKVGKYSHIIISTPSENHHASYRNLRDLGFKGRIYIDKPVVIADNDINIFADEDLFCGMTERYNPVVTELKALLKIDKLISIKFIRYSVVPDNIKTPVIFDLGIHDLDLYLYLLGFDKLPGLHDVFEESKTCHILAKQDNVLSTFEWSHESRKRERKITVLQEDKVYEADLIDQTILVYEPGNIIKNLYVNKGQSLERTMKHFLEGGNCNAKLAHEFMFDIISRKRK